MTEFLMKIKPAPRTPRKIRDELSKMHVTLGPTVGLMRTKGIKYIPAIISSAFACGEDEIDEQKANPYVSELMRKVNVMIRNYRDDIRTRLSPRIFWPIQTLEMKEVKDELEILLTNDLFSKEDPNDRKLAEEDLKNCILSKEMEKMTPEQRIDDHIDFLNGNMRLWGEFFKGAYEIHKQHNVEMWFHIIGL